MSGVGFDARDVRRRVREIGRRLTAEALDASQAIYAPLHASEHAGGPPIARDLRYGPHPRHRLDLCRPGADEPRPALLFVHGGGFVAGDKRREGGPFYDNIPLWAARNGLVGANMTYRLAPDHAWPSGAEDVAAAVRWLQENGEAHGVDAKRIYVMGQSAGAAHVASYLARAPESAGLAGAILVSGVYDLTRADPRTVQAAYYGTDAAAFAERSSAAGAAKRGVPLLLAAAEFDPPHFELQTLAMLEAAHAHTRRLPRFLQLVGHNHITGVLHMGLPRDQLGEAILDFMAHAASPRDAR